MKSRTLGSGAPSLCVSCAVTLFVFACLGVATVTAQSVGAPPGNGADVLAVIPFHNISGAAGDDWIGGGIAETLMADLQGAATVDVIAQEAVLEAMSAIGFTGAVPVLEVGRRLGARWLVTGGYQRLGDQLRITARLVDAATGAVVRSAKIDGAIDDLFGLQDRIAAELVADDGIATDPARESRPPAPRAGPTSPPVANSATTSEGSSPSTPLVRRSVRMPPPATVATPLTAPSRVVGDPEPGAVSGIPSTLSINGFAAVGVIDGPPPPMPPAVISRDERGRATIRAIKLTEGIRLDGQLDERVYDTVASVSDFVQQEPDEGALATEQTEVWVMFDRQTIYIAARCWNSQPDRIVANEMKRDSTGLFGNETFAVVLDTFYDRRSGFGFMTNPLGALFDATITNERTANPNWNTVWDVRTGRFEQGWTLEIAISFKSLRYGSGPAQSLGHQFTAPSDLEERGFVSDADSRLTRPVGAAPALLRSYAGRSRGAVIRNPARDQAVRDFGFDDRPERGSAALEQRRRRLRRRGEVRCHARPDGRPHLQHGFRAGGG